MGSSETYILSILLQLKDQASPGLDAFSAKLRTLSGEGGKARSSLSGFEKIFRGFEAAGRIKDVWGRAVDSLHEYTDAYLTLLRSQERFRMIGLSEGDNARAFKAVDNIVKSMKGVTFKEATETITDLHVALGDLNHAIEALPEASKFRFSFSTLFGDKFNDEQMEQQIQSAYRALEMMGKVAKGREAMEHGLNVMAQIGASTSGRIMPSDMFQMARRGGTSIQGLSDEGLRNLVAPMIELKGEGAGTAMMSAYQALVGGVMKQSSAAEFARLDLLDPRKIEYGKAQQIKRLRPGANVLGDPFMEDPLKAADQLVAAMKGHGIDTSDPNKIRQELAVLFQNRTAQRLMSILTTQRGQVVKESGLAANAKDVGGSYDQATKDALGRIKAYEAALENFRASVGKPLVDVGTKLATNALPFFQFFADHPYWAASIIVGAKGLGAMAETATILNQSGILDWFRRATRGAGSFDDSILRASRNAGGLSDRLSSLSSVGKIAIAVEITYTVVQAAKLVGEMYEGYEANQGVETANQQDVGALKRSKKKGVGITPEIAKSRAASDFYLLTRTSKFDSPLGEMDVDYFGEAMNRRHGRARTMWDTVGKGLAFMPPNPYTAWGGWSDRVAGATIKSQMGDLAVPEIMGNFLSIARSKLSPEEYGKVSHTLEQTFPASFKAATEQLQTSILSLKGQTDPLGQSIKNVISPLDNMPSKLSGANTALENFATKVNSITIQSPAPDSGGGSDSSTTNNQTGQAPRASSGASRHVIVRPHHSAIGSIVHSDGLIKVHKGNVIFPARLSRRSPGDWLNTLSSLRTSSLETREPVARASLAGYGGADMPVAVPITRTVKAVGSSDSAGIEARTSPARNITIQNLNLDLSFPNYSGGSHDIPKLAKEVAVHIAHQLEVLRERNNG